MTEKDIPRTGLIAHGRVGSEPTKNLVDALLPEIFVQYYPLDITERF